MGNLYTNICWGGDPDQLNALSGLSRRDVYIIQKSWKPVYKNSLANGVQLFKRFFRVDSEAKDYFKMLRNVRESQYSNVDQFRAHVITFMASLNTVISFLNEPEEARALLHKIGYSHNMKGIEKRHFGIFKEVVARMLIEDLMFDRKTMASWSRALNFWWQCLYEKIDERYARKSRKRTRANDTRLL